MYSLFRTHTYIAYTACTTNKRHRHAGNISQLLIIEGSSNYIIIIYAFIIPYCRIALYYRRLLSKTLQISRRTMHIYHFVIDYYLLIFDLCLARGLQYERTLFCFIYLRVRLTKRREYILFSDTVFLFPMNITFVFNLIKQDHTVCV